MNLTTRRIVAIAGALAISFGAAACSSSNPPASTTTSTAPTTPAQTTTTTEAADVKASEILEKAKTNALASTSGSFAGQVDQNGETLSIEFKGTSDGKTSDISVDTGTKGKVRLISVGGAVYMQGDAAFWKSQGAPASVQAAEDKFIKAPASAAGMTDSLSLKNFLDQAFGAVKASQLADTVEEETINGVETYVLTDKRGKAEGALYISKDTFDVIRFTGSSASPGQLDFAQWNEDLGITAPPASQILDIS